MIVDLDIYDVLLQVSSNNSLKPSLLFFFPFLSDLSCRSTTFKIYRRDTKELFIIIAKKLPNFRLTILGESLFFECKIVL